jgi:NAD-dependent deacetylase
MSFPKSMTSAHPTIVILTGAGISAESGLPTFRDANGLWHGHRVEEVATPQAFAANPKLVHEFYNMRRAALKTVKPNAAHEAIARLQREHGGKVVLVTQNVDDLHERGGSPSVIHMHGEIRKVRCARCHMDEVWEEDLSTETACRICKRTACMRPHIVWFGEMPFHMDEIQDALDQADVFIAIGTSGHVYPAAGFVQMARGAGARTIEVNLDETAASDSFGEHRIGPATAQVPPLVAELLGRSSA